MKDLRVLSWAGGGLFALGMLAFLMAWVRHDAAPETVRMVLSAAVLLSLGYPAMLHVGALRKIAALEARVAEMEKK
jgi:hypothetical protein